MQLAPAFSTLGRATHCSFCGSGPGKENPLDPKSQDRPIVTTDTDIEMEGIFEFCLSCAAEAGALAGMIPEAQADTLHADREAAIQRALDLEVDLESARLALRTLSSEFNTQQALLEPPADDLD